MTYKVIEKYNGAIIGREAEKQDIEGYKGGAYTFECNGNGCDSITLSGVLIKNLPTYFKKITKPKNTE